MRSKGWLFNSLVALAASVMLCAGSPRFRRAIHRSRSGSSCQPRRAASPISLRGHWRRG